MLGNKKGISIVELMVSVMIIVILSSVVFSRMHEPFRRSKEALVKSNMYTLKVAAEDFASMAHGLYPRIPNNSVQEVLSDIGINSNNQMRIADNCPATASEVNTGSGYALLPGNQTFINPFLYNGNCIDYCSMLPPHASIAPYSSGQGTVYWDTSWWPYGTYSSSGYAIYGDGYRALLNLELWQQ